MGKVSHDGGQGGALRGVARLHSAGGDGLPGEGGGAGVAFGFQRAAGRGLGGGDTVGGLGPRFAPGLTAGALVRLPAAGEETPAGGQRQRQETASPTLDQVQCTAPPAASAARAGSTWPAATGSAAAGSGGSGRRGGASGASRIGCGVRARGIAAAGSA